MQKLTPNDFGPFTLSKSCHENPQEGMCVMEMVSFLAGEEWSDMPECSSPVVSHFCQVLNDRMGQEFRDRLQTYVPRLIGTASPKHDKERAEYLAWAAIKTFAPIALDRAGLHDHADRLRNFDVGLGFADAAAAAAAADRAADRAVRAAYASARAAAAAARASATYAAAAADAAAASDAARAADAVDHKTIFKVLDGLLEIGPSGSNYTQEQAARVELLRKATKQFA